MKILIIALGLMFSLQADQTITNLCEGFAPQNNMSIPVAPKGWLQVGGVTETEFHAVLDRFAAVMAGDITERGGNLVINRLWDSPEVNAYADRIGDDYLIDMHGGLARHQLMTPDGLILVACHEIGHHIGGFPQYGWFSADKMSNEGQSDYFATLKCFRRLFTLDENREWLTTATVPEFAVRECARHAEEQEQLSCYRSVMAGIVLGNVLADIGHEGAQPVLGQYDPTIVVYTQDYHPQAQCRLDTYANGAFCTRTVAERVSDSNEIDGTCERANGFDYGYRPRCWFKPATPDPVEPTQLELPF